MLIAKTTKPSASSSNATISSGRRRMTPVAVAGGFLLLLLCGACCFVPTASAAESAITKTCIYPPFRTTCGGVCTYGDDPREFERIFPQGAICNYMGDDTNYDSTNVCHQGYCDGQGRGQENCQAGYRPEGFECGTATGICFEPPMCDGLGHCNVDPKPEGFECGTETGPCIETPSTCDGDGNCVGPTYKPSTQACGTATSLCMEDPMCDGFGTCLDAPVYKAAGEECGTATGPCMEAPTCDGSGTCNENPAYKALGDVCGTSTVAGPCIASPPMCDGSGSCLDIVYKAAGDVCGIATSPCMRTPLCDDSGYCQVGYEDYGTPCTLTDTGEQGHCSGADGCLPYSAAGDSCFTDVACGPDHVCHPNDRYCAACYNPYYDPNNMDLGLICGCYILYKTPDADAAAPLTVITCDNDYLSEPTPNFFQKKTGTTIKYDAFATTATARITSKVQITAGTTWGYKRVLLTTEPFTGDMLMEKVVMLGFFPNGRLYSGQHGSNLSSGYSTGDNIELLVTPSTIADHYDIQVWINGVALAESYPYEHDTETYGPTPSFHVTVAIYTPGSSLGVKGVA